MSAPKKRRIVDAAIKTMSPKGNGIGTFLLPDGSESKVEVPFTMPNDRAEALLLRKKSGVFTSLLQNITVPSPDRIAPRCLHFGVCGGCRWQHTPYETQLDHKEKMVKQWFASLAEDTTLFHPIQPSASPWEYRNKMEFSFSCNAAGDRFVGLVMDSSRGKVFNLTECHLVHPWFAKGVGAVREWWAQSGLDAYHPNRNSGTLRTLTLREGRRTGDRMAILTVSGNPDYAPKKHHLESFITSLRKAIEPQDSGSYLSIFLRIQQIAKGMATNFYEMQLYGPDHIREILHIVYDPNKAPLSLLFKISPSAFFQPNPLQAEQLYSIALQNVEIHPESVVYDLYCGTGTMGICAAKMARQVIGIELSPESALDARMNAKSNGFENVEILSGTVSDVLKKIRSENTLPLPDIVFVDPPRVGLESIAIQHLIELRPAKILYVSCNPITQAENIAALLPAGYKIKSLHPIDQFPQTVHVENIAVLEKVQNEIHNP